jgi:hypothetical protein
MDKVQKHNSFNTDTPSSESYRNYLSNFKLPTITNADMTAVLASEVVPTLM